MWNKSKILYYFRPIFAISLTICICLLLLEIGLRCKGHIASNMTDGMFEKHGNSYRLKRNLIKKINWPSFSYVVYTNSFGFRAIKNEIKKAQNTPYIIFLGDSLTFANGVNYEESFVGIFSKESAKKNIDVINMAVGGHYFEDQKALFMEFVNNSQKKPSMVFLCFTPTLIRTIDENHENIIVKNGYLFEEGFWQGAYIRLLLGNISSAYCFFRDKIRKVSLKYIKNGTGNSEGILEYYNKRNQIYEHKWLMEFENRIKEFKDYCFENKITPVLVYLPIVDSLGLNELVKKIGKNPEDYDLNYYEELLKSCSKKHNITLLNIMPIFQLYYNKGVQLRFKLDGHFSEIGNRIVGEYLIKETFNH